MPRGNYVAYYRFADGIVRILRVLHRADHAFTKYNLLNQINNLTKSPSCIPEIDLYH